MLALEGEVLQSQQGLMLFERWFQAGGWVEVLAFDEGVEVAAFQAAFSYAALLASVEKSCKQSAQQKAFRVSYLSTIHAYISRRLHEY